MSSPAGLTRTGRRSTTTLRNVVHKRSSTVSWVLTSLKRVDEAVSNAFQYQFTTVPQFTAILETMGYECYTEDDEIVLKRNGEVQEKVKVQLVESKISQEKQDKKRMAQLKAVLKKYRDMSANRQELQDVMKTKFGISLVFLGSKDSPYGYLIVDHHTKAVFKGSDVPPL